MIRIGLTGGIGSGKSTAAHIFSMLGVPIYNSDIQSKLILSEDSSVVQKVVDLLGERAYINGVADRQFIAQKVFADKKSLSELNKIIHPAVRDNYRVWANLHSNYSYTIIESAILIESGFNYEVDKVIVVTAPESVRIERTVERDASSSEAVRARIEAQMNEQERLEFADHILYADEVQLLIPQIINLNNFLIL